MSWIATTPCSKCGMAYCMCTTSIPTTIDPLVMTPEEVLKKMERRITIDRPGAKIASTKDINWREYIAARPPESGDYLVAGLFPETGKNDWYFSSYDKEKMIWNDVKGITQFVVTHYAKLELP